jgi:hypothetical protein
MPERRKAQRFTLPCPAQAHLHVVNDVVIERIDAETLTVLSAEASVAGEEFALQLRGAKGQMVTVPVRTIRSQPALVAGPSPGYRLELQVMAAAAVGEEP